METVDRNILPSIVYFLKLLSAFFWFLSALFALWNYSLIKQLDNIKNWFDTKWKSINESPWLDMPERVIKWLIKFRYFSLNYDISSLKPDPSSKTHPRIGIKAIIIVFYLFSLFVSMVFILPLICWIHFGWRGILLLLGLVIIGIFLLPILNKILLKVAQKEHVKSRYKLMYDFINYLTMAFEVGIIIIILSNVTLFILKLNIGLSLLLSIIILPFYFSMCIVTIPSLTILTRLIKKPVFSLIKSRVSSESEESKSGSIETNTLEYRFLDWTSLFPLGLAPSFTFMIFALWLGRIFSPQTYIPKTFQMLFFNSISNGLMLVTTIFILSYTVSRGILIIPFGIVLNFIIAGLIACFSLYLGLISTPHALSINQIMNVLSARSIDGKSFEIGPYFFVMCTMFIPITFYLSIVFVSCLGKIALIPIEKFFAKGRELDQPLNYTAAVFAILGAFFSILVVIMNKY